MNLDATSHVLLISSQLPEDQELVESGVRFLQSVQLPCTWIAIGEGNAERPILWMAKGKQPEVLTVEQLEEAFEQAAHIFLAISVDLACTVYENAALTQLLNDLTPAVAGKFLSAAIRYCGAQEIAISFGFNPGLIPAPQPLSDFQETDVWWRDYILPQFM